MDVDAYREFFTKDYMMGPNALRLLAEVLEKYGDPARCGTALDLGCGEGLTTLFLARETAAERIFAVDLWIPAEENHRRFLKWGCDGRVIPLHADATELPFADEYFDTIVSVDSYHYFGYKDDDFFARKILPLLKKGGSLLLAIPGLKSELPETPALMTEWAGDETVMFHSAPWWKEHIAHGCEDAVEVEACESARFDSLWQDWYDTGHEYALRDREFLERGLKDVLNFVLVRATKKQ